MPDCTPLSSHTGSVAIITKDNIYDLLPDSYSLTPGTQVTVSCLSGLRLVGVSTFTCQTNGQWSYSSKPYCTDEPEPTATEESLDETSKIIIGVVCGIAALLVIALIAMIVFMVIRDRRKRKERKLLVQTWDEDRRHIEDFRGKDGPSTIDVEMYPRYPHPGPPAPYDYGHKGKDGPSTIDVEMYPRYPHPGPPAPYDYGHKPPVHREGNKRMYSPKPDYNRYHDNRRHTRKTKSHDDSYELENNPRLGNRMYLPPMPERPYPDYHHGDGRRKGYSKSHDDLSETDRKPYVREWISRSSMEGAEEYARPGVHGNRHGRDPYLWRQANY